MTRVGTVSLVVAGVLATSLVAGCDSSADAETTPSTTPSATVSSPSPTASDPASPTPSPTDSAPDIPAAARKKTDAGAKAFVKYFFDQFNVAWTRPQLGLITSLSDPECQFCKKTEATARSLSRDGQHYRDDPLTLKRLQLFGGAPADEQYVSVQLTQSRADVVNDKGKVVKTDSRKDETFYVTLRWVGGRWRFLELEKTR